jgi:hypothetical protein
MRTAPRKLGMVTQYIAGNSTHSALQANHFFAPSHREGQIP